MMIHYKFKKIGKLARKSGFCFWQEETWKPENQWIDWSSNYDEAFIDYTKRLLKSVSKKHNLDYNTLLEQYDLT